MFTLFLGGLTAGLGRFKFTTLAATLSTFDVFEFKVDDLVDDNVDNTAGPKGIRRGVLNSIIGRSVGRTLVVLQLGMIAQSIGKILVLAVRSKCRSELRFSKIADLPVKLAWHIATFAQACQFGHLRIHFSGMLNHLLHGQFNLANNIVSTVAIRVPEFDTQVFIGFDKFWGDKECCGLFPKRVQIIGDDSGAVHGLAVFGERQSDVWVAASPFTASLVLLAEVFSAMNPDPHDTKGMDVLCDIVTLKQSPHVERHRLRRDVHASSRSNGIVDEVGDQRKVENVDAFLDHWYAASLNVRSTHQCEG